jgi:TolB-like protein/DNA-binding winged helix-turn-helix (wHTH) protein/Tfp pilus assembly protein PilF
MDRQTRRLYEFGGFRIDTRDRLLQRGGSVVPLKPKVLETLLVLLRRRGEVLEKDDLIHELWPDTFVEEGNLTQNIYELRKALGENPSAPVFIETVPRRGYRFIAEVKETVDEGAAPGPETTLRSGYPQAAADTVPHAPRDGAHEFPPPPAKRTGFNSGVFLISLFSLCLLGVAAVYWRLHPTGGRPVASPPVRSIAVLPFKGLSPEPDGDLLGAGMADALITKLSNVKNLTVLPTGSVLRYAGRDVDPRAAGSALGVDCVLDGKVQRAGDSIRVTVQLVRVADGASLWARQFDEKFTNLFGVQDAISEQAARALTVRLSDEERGRLRKHYTEDVEAYQAYLTGRYFWNKRTAEGYRKGIDQFRQAIGRDQNYALAYAGLADCYVRLNERGRPPAEGVIPRAKAAVARALEIDDSLAEAHATLGFIKFRFDWDFAGAGGEFRRAIELDPNYAIAHQWYAFYLLATDRAPEAPAELRRARELDPLSLNVGSGFGSYFYFTRRYDEAIDQLRKTLEMDPAFGEARWTLGLAYEQKGMTEQALKEFRDLLSISDGNTGVNASVGHLYAVTGRSAEARGMLLRLQEMSKRRYVPPYDVAVIYAGLGEEEEALAWLEKAYDDHSLRPVWLKFDPRLDGLRGNARYVELVGRVFRSGGPEN